MGLAILALTTLAAGLALAPLGSRLLPGPNARGHGRSLSRGLIGLGAALLVASAVVVIDVGEVGVKHFLGSVDPAPLLQGVHVINPLASVEKMSIREQSFPSDGSVERMEAQTSEQLNVSLEVSLLYRLVGSDAPSLYQRLGTEDQIKNRIVLNAVRNGVRDAIATKSINQVFSPDRRELASTMHEAIQSKAGDRIEVLDVFVRDIQAPERVREAIEAKLQREQQVASERFQTEIVQERARQQMEEAKGIAEAQQIITAGLTPQYLTWYYIEQLGKLPEGSLIVVPTEGGVPLLRSIGR